MGHEELEEAMIRAEREKMMRKQQKQRKMETSAGETELNLRSRCGVN